MKVLRLYNTVRYLKPIQLYARVYYKFRAFLRRIIGRRPVYTLYRQGQRVSFSAQWLEKAMSYKGNNTFEFLNIETCVKDAWDYDSNGELWRYNLNYMDFLLQPSMTAEEGYGLIDSFIEALPANKVATDPYPISLRGINWIKFVSRHYDSLAPEQLKRIDAALYSQYRILMESTEKHLMANHYLENGFSLLYGACYFDDGSLYRKAEKILYTQLKEQILPDGAHYELSPMYHCIMLERLLDCYNIIDKNRHHELACFLRDKAGQMSGWLEAVLMSDGCIPLLNDSAKGIAQSPQDIFMYARTLGISWQVKALGTSGYRKFKGDAYDVLVDVAALGPSYNLGHSHADTFTFVMNVAGKPFIVDTGTSTYTQGERRSFERSTMAHNTVCIAGMDSSQVWGAFRCAKRARVIVLNDDGHSLTASHDGYRDIAAKVCRTFVPHHDRLEIIDEVCVAGDKYECTAVFCLSPDVHVVAVRADSVVTTYGTLCFSGASKISVGPLSVAEEFNSLRPSNRIIVTFYRKLTTMLLPETQSEQMIIT